MKNGWRRKPLGEACRFIDYRGRTPEKVESGLRLITAKNVKMGYLQTEPLEFVKPEIYDTWMTRGIPKIGDVIFTTEAPLANVAQLDTDEKVVFAQRIIVLQPPTFDLDRTFLKYQLLSDEAQKRILEKGTGATVIGIKAKLLKTVEIGIPPLPDQHRIVGILDEAFAAIATAKANAEKNLQNVRALFESILNVAIQGKLIVSNGNNGSVAELMRQIESFRADAIKEGRAKPLKTSLVEMDGDSKLAENWQWAQLEQLTVGISDGVHKKPKYTTEGVPFIKVNNLTAGPGISFDNVNFISRADHEEFIKRTCPEKGDILITKDGTIGVVRLIRTDAEFSIFVSVALIKPVMQELGPYLVYALRSSCVQSQIVPQGAALKHLYLVDLRKLAIPLPPLSEQNLIVARLDSLAEETHHLESIYQRKLAALDELKKSLLHQAFSGKL